MNNPETYSGVPTIDRDESAYKPLESPTAQPVDVTQRVVTGWHTAKRLLQVLQLSINRHEAAFGVLESDVQKRVRHA